MKVRIPAFLHGDCIPVQYSRKGGNISPEIAFEQIPHGTKSLVLIMDDPDAPHGLFTHWVVYNIDPNCGGFKENELPETATPGRNSWDEARYGGPQPPDREHRYFFRLYAVDCVLPLSGGASRGEVERAMDGHIVDEAEYMGLYAPHTAELSRGR